MQLDRNPEVKLRILYAKVQKTGWGCISHSTSCASSLKGPVPLGIREKRLVEKTRSPGPLRIHSHSGGLRRHQPLSGDTTGSMDFCP